MSEEPEKLVIVRTFRSKMPAEMASLALRTHGVEVRGVDDDCGGAQPLFQMPIGIDLKVKESDAQKAIEILEEMEDQDKKQ